MKNFEKMTKAQITEKIESIPAVQLSLAVTSIMYRNPFNEISINRVIVRKCGNHVTGIRFQTRATKQNMIIVYKEILNQIAISFGIEEARKIEAGYTPIWWEDDTNEETQEVTMAKPEDAMVWDEDGEEVKERKTMTKAEAIREITHLDAGTLARIFGSTKYEVIDDGINRMIITADQMTDADFEGCRNWIDVMDTINRWSEHKNWYLTGNADYRQYLVKYSRGECEVILRNYVEVLKILGTINTKPEQDYIRGAKDALCIA